MNQLLHKIDEYFKEIASYRPFKDKNLLNNIKNFYRIECTWSSNSLEGNSYTISETKVLLEDGLTAGGKPLKDAMETIGHAKAFDHMFTLSKNKFLTEKDLCFMHSLLSGNLETDSITGNYRKIPVYITGSKYSTAKESEIPILMKELIEKQKKLFETFHPVDAAAKFHKELVFIHPFEDGNGRVSRLAMNTLLIQRGFLPVSIPPVLRSDYIQSLERAHTNDSNFVKLIENMEYETQKDFCRLINGYSSSIKHVTTKSDLENNINSIIESNSEVLEDYRQYRKEYIEEKKVITYALKIDIKEKIMSIEIFNHPDLTTSEIENNYTQKDTSDVILHTTTDDKSIDNIEDIIKLKLAFEFKKNDNKERLKKNLTSKNKHKIKI
ncbi:MAG: Fic family protein [Lachnospiraceae bacterium]|nr:Fic family protein [Lachnospiraceae bacterium]